VIISRRSSRLARQQLHEDLGESIGPPNLLGDFSNCRQMFPSFSMLAACEIPVERETYPSFSIIQLRRFFGTCRQVQALFLTLFFVVGSVTLVNSVPWNNGPFV